LAGGQSGGALVCVPACPRACVPAWLVFEKERAFSKAQAKTKSLHKSGPAQGKINHSHVCKEA